MGIEQLENKGFSFLNIENINHKKRQIVVVGSARGGTSLVAGALHHLGVFTGDKSNPPVFEDVLLSEAFESNDLDQAKSVIERYSENNDVWAWKRPAALNYLNKVEEVIPNPFYIFIFKDIFSIANRNNISMNFDINKGLKKALVDYGKIIEFISKTDKPVMLVSAEKALQNKEKFIDALIFINNDIKDLKKNKDFALKFITPNPKDYLDVTRITKAKGVIDQIKPNVISGWAFFLHSSKNAVIEVYENGILKHTEIADILRKDLKLKNIHSTGYCGFRIDFNSEDNQLSGNIKVKVKGDINILTNGEVNL